MDEFDLIDWIRQQAGPGGGDLRLGIGDDAAVLAVPSGQELVITTDTLSSGIHFSPGDPPESVGHKALAVNLSDLAAMGAQPRWALLSVTLPLGSESWIRGFIRGFLNLAGQFNVRLVGGDTGSGVLSVTVTALGCVEAGRYLARHGARPGDLVVVSGCLGDAAYALQSIEGGETPDPEALQRLRRPVPRVGLGAALVGKASACIDISDGLMADLNHVTDASGCAAQIEAQKLPASPALADCPAAVRYSLQLTGGDDYELCFTLPQGKGHVLEDLSRTQDIGLSVIGQILEGSGVRCLGPDGSELEFETGGYTHQL